MIQTSKFSFLGLNVHIEFSAYLNIMNKENCTITMESGNSLSTDNVIREQNHVFKTFTFYAELSYTVQSKT